MLYRITIRGTAPIIHHSAAGLDPLLPINAEIQAITRKRGSNRTPADDARLRELETIRSLWLDSEDKPTIPASAIRKVIETSAKRLKQGGQVREGLDITNSVFAYDYERYGESIEELQRSTQFTVPVVVQRNRILRTRAKFDTPWSCTFGVDADDDQVSPERLERWLDVAGRQIGLGDWRPEKSGIYGRFEVEAIEEVREETA